MRVRNHVIGTAIKKTKCKTGAKSTKMGQSPVRIAAKTPVTTVAR